MYLADVRNHGSDGQRAWQSKGDFRSHIRCGRSASRTTSGNLSTKAQISRANGRHNHRGRLAPRNRENLKTSVFYGVDSTPQRRWPLDASIPGRTASLRSRILNRMDEAEIQTPPQRDMATRQSTGDLHRGPFHGMYEPQGSQRPRSRKIRSDPPSSLVNSSGCLGSCFTKFRDGPGEKRPARRARKAEAPMAASELNVCQTRCGSRGSRDKSVNE